LLTSSTSASWTEAIFASVDGLNVSNVFPLEELTNFPSISNYVTLGLTVENPLLARDFERFE
jgi:hypothetical protein